MPKALTDKEKARRLNDICKVSNIIQAAGGNKVVISHLRKKNPSLYAGTAANWVRRGDIPDRYYLDVLSLQNKYGPSYLKPELYNRKHSVFVKHYSS